MSNSPELTLPDVLTAIDESWTALISAIDNAPADRRDETGVCGIWSLRQVVAHVAFWDAFEAERLSKPKEIDEVDWQALNDRNIAETWSTPFDRLRQDLDSSHAAMLEGLSRNPAADPQWVYGLTVEHYREHADEIAWWLARTQPNGDRSHEPPVPVSTILPKLDGAWEDWLLAIDEVPISAREVKGISGEWSLKDLIGHVTFWDTQLIDDIVGYKAGRPPIQLDVDGWNAREATRTASSTFEDLLAQMHGTHDRMRSLLVETDGIDAEMVAVDTWEHYADHARDMRAWLTATAGG